MELSDLIKIRKKADNEKIPLYTPTFEEISEQMKINAEILMKEITGHADKEIERIKKELNKHEYTD